MSPKLRSRNSYTSGSTETETFHDFDEVTDDLIDTVLEFVATLPDPQSEVFRAPRRCPESCLGLRDRVSGM